MTKTLLCGSSPNNKSIARLFSLHLIATLLFTILLAIHISYVHRSRPGVHHSYIDGSSTLLDVILKDSHIISPIIAIISVSIQGLLIHADN